MVEGSSQTLSSPILPTMRWGSGQASRGSPQVLRDHPVLCGDKIQGYCGVPTFSAPGVSCQWLPEETPECAPLLGLLRQAIQTQILLLKIISNNNDNDLATTHRLTLNLITTLPNINTAEKLSFPFYKKKAHRLGEGIPAFLIILVIA